MTDTDDLEARIRDALRSRSDSVEPDHETVRIPTSRRLTAGIKSYAPLLAAACIGLLVVVITVVVPHGSSKDVVGGSGYVGYRWNLTTVSDQTGSLTVPKTVKAYVSFGSDGKFGAEDGVNFHSGTYDRNADGYATRNLSTTFAGFGGAKTSPTGRVIAAMASVLNTSVGTKLEANTLRLQSTETYLLTFRRGVRVGPAPTPSSTPSSVSIAHLAPYVGYRWTLTRISDAEGTLAVPADYHADLAFPSRTRILANDVVGARQADLQLLGNGFFSTDDVVSTGGGTGISTVSQKRLVIALGTVFLAAPPKRVAASVVGDTLTLGNGSTTLTLTRAGPATSGTAAPSATSSS